MKLRGVVVVLAVSGSLSGAWACGAATGVGIFDDAGGQDATLDSSGDVVLVDVGGDSSSCPMASDLGSQRPSCAPGGAGMTNCGPGGSGTESCCTSPEVCGGTYYRTYANDGGPAAEADPAIVSDFRLDKYLVTVGRFRQFVNAWKEGAGYAPRAGSGKHTHLNGGMGLANSASPETYEPGWIPSDDDHVEPTDANLTCWTGISDGAGAPDPWSTWTRVAGTQENLPVAGAGDDTGMGGVTRGMAAAFLGLRAWLWHAGRVVTSVVARGSVRRCPSYARARAISSPFAE